MQELLLDRRLVGKILDHLNIPTPLRIEATRDGGPKVSLAVRKTLQDHLHIEIPDSVSDAVVSLSEDGDTIFVNGQRLEKPFVEKPVSGEDHNIFVYFKGGGGRRLFRKVRHNLCSTRVVS